MSQTTELEAWLDDPRSRWENLSREAERHRVILSEVARRDPRFEPPRLPLERARQQLAVGQPLLHGLVVDPDLDFCLDLFTRLLQRERELGRSPESTARLASAQASGTLDFQRAVEEALAAHDDHLAKLASWAEVPQDVLVALLHLTLQPVLRSLATAYAPLLRRTGRDWDHAYCPICAAWAPIAEVHEAVPQRRLRCLRCGGAWMIQHAGCSYCGNRNADTLGCLLDEGEPRYRVETCSRCRQYQKLIETPEPAPHLGLILQDWATAHLDGRAVEAGYRRPAGTGFRLELADPEPDEALEDLLEAD